MCIRDRNNLLDKSNINTSAIIEILKKTSISFSFNSKNQNIISVDGIQLEDKIRTFKISSLVSLLAEKNEIRKYIVKIQKGISRNKSIVMDGRDIGTVVFPNASELGLHLSYLRRIQPDRLPESVIPDAIAIDLIVAV